MKAILADSAVKKALVSISPTSRQNHFISQLTIEKSDGGFFNRLSPSLTFIAAGSYQKGMSSGSVSGFVPLRFFLFGLFSSVASGPASVFSLASASSSARFGIGANSNESAIRSSSPLPLFA